MLCNLACEVLDLNRFGFPFRGINLEDKMFTLLLSRISVTFFSSLLGESLANYVTALVCCFMTPAGLDIKLPEGEFEVFFKLCVRKARTCHDLI